MAARNPIEGAAGIVEMFVTVDMFRDLAKPIDKWVMVAIANKWLTDQSWNNTVAVSFAEGPLVFMKKPDGSYLSPGGDPSVLTLTSGAYKLVTAQKVEYNFNTDGNISTIVFPEGVTITYSYSSGKLISVTNGLGRTLSLSYTGDRLTSVSDGTGRSVSFTVDSNKNLTTATDPNKSTTFQYGLPGQMTKIFKPANPSSYIVFNTYDALGRVKEQKDAYDNTTKLYLAGSRSEEEDPLGNKTVFYFNRDGGVTRLIDKVGKEWKTEFDGLNRVVKTIAPEGNAIQYEYNSSNQVTKVTAKAKSGSGLSDLVNEFTYSSTWNKVATAKDALNRTPRRVERDPRSRPKRQPDSDNLARRLLCRARV
jgi:YD repeat-containing protein